MEWYYILLIAIWGTILLLLFVMGYLSAKRVSRPKCDTRQQQKDYIKAQGWAVEFEGMETDEHDFVMPDGYVLHGEITKNENPVGNVILCHGHTSTREAMRRIGRMYYDMGYRVVLYDQPGHGDNVKRTITMGLYESECLNNVIKQCTELFGQKIDGVHGVSMGAATVMMVRRFSPDIAWIVEDCGYSDLGTECAEVVRKFNLPVFMIKPFTWLAMKLLYGFTFKDVRPMDCVKMTNIPLLIIHGTADKYVLPTHAQRIYDACTSDIKEIRYFEDAAHANCFTKYKEEYAGVVKEFLEEVKS